MCALGLMNGITGLVEFILNSHTELVSLKFRCVCVCHEEIKAAAFINNKCSNYDAI